MDTKRIGKKIRFLRREKGESVRQLAEVLGVSRTSVGYYEHGDRIPRDALKQKIADHYGVTVQEIFFT